MQERDEPSAPVAEPLDENKPDTHGTSEADQGGIVIIPQSAPDPTDSD